MDLVWQKFYAPLTTWECPSVRSDPHTSPWSTRSTRGEDRGKVSQWPAADWTQCPCLLPSVPPSGGLHPNHFSFILWLDSLVCVPARLWYGSGEVEIPGREAHSEAFRGAKEMATNHSYFCVAHEILALPLCCVFLLFSLVPGLFLLPLRPFSQGPLQTTVSDSVMRTEVTRVQVERRVNETVPGSSKGEDLHHLQAAWNPEISRKIHKAGLHGGMTDSPESALDTSL